MNPRLLLFLSLIGVTVSILVSGGGGGRGRFDDDSRHYSGGGDSSDSGDNSHEHHPHPHRPPRPNPPRELTKCPDSWILFKRPQGNWCVGLYVAQVSQPVAETRCRDVGATLTGLQSDQERQQLASAGQQMALKHNFGDAAIWLGARRKGSCLRAGMCQPRETFFWTDNHTTGNDGFGWSTGQPDGVWSNVWGVQACAHQFVFASGTTHPRWPGIPHGALDDQYCQEGNINPNAKLFACGKKAV